MSDHRGQRMVWHTGGFPGPVSLVSLLPQLNLGLVALINQESDAAYNAILLHGLDHYLHSPYTIGSVHWAGLNVLHRHN